ncbi:MAG TPA: hypothetical protein VJP88_07580 [Caulobacteraceae bacterium]|nr:hypothetical protein [Caulobacteraceae bacterium]
MADLLELVRHPFVGGDDVVEDIRDPPGDPSLIPWQPHRKVPDAHGLKRSEQLPDIEPPAAIVAFKGSPRPPLGFGGMGQKFIDRVDGGAGGC